MRNLPSLPGRDHRDIAKTTSQNCRSGESALAKSLGDAGIFAFAPGINGLQSERSAALHRACASAKRAAPAPMNRRRSCLYPAIKNA